MFLTFVVSFAIYFIKCVMYVQILLLEFCLLEAKQEGRRVSGDLFLCGKFYNGVIVYWKIHKGTLSPLGHP